MTDQPKSNPPTNDEQCHTDTQATPTGKTLEGWRPPLDTDEQMRYALDQAFDYRGDVTIATTDDRSLQGYVYDRQDKAEGLSIRMMPSDGSGRVTLGQSQILGLTFSGKDTAEGRSFEAWVKKYAEKKRAGQEASIYHDSP